MLCVTKIINELNSETLHCDSHGGIDKGHNYLPLNAGQECEICGMLFFIIFILNFFYCCTTLFCQYYYLQK